MQTGKKTAINHNTNTQHYVKLIGKDLKFDGPRAHGCKTEDETLARFLKNYIGVNTKPSEKPFLVLCTEALAIIDQKDAKEKKPMAAIALIKMQQHPKLIELESGDELAAPLGVFLSAYPERKRIFQSDFVERMPAVDIFRHYFFKLFNSKITWDLKTDLSVLFDDHNVREKIYAFLEEEIQKPKIFAVRIYSVLYKLATHASQQEKEEHILRLLKLAIMKNILPTEKVRELLALFSAKQLNEIQACLAILCANAEPLKSYELVNVLAETIPNDQKTAIAAQLLPVAKAGNTQVLTTFIRLAPALQKDQKQELYKIFDLANPSEYRDLKERRALYVKIEDGLDEKQKQLAAHQAMADMKDSLKKDDVPLLARYGDRALYGKIFRELSVDDQKQIIETYLKDDFLSELFKMQDKELIDILISQLNSDEILLVIGGLKRKIVTAIANTNSEAAVEVSFFPDIYVYFFIHIIALSTNEQMSADTRQHNVIFAMQYLDDARCVNFILNEFDFLANNENVGAAQKRKLLEKIFIAHDQDNLSYLLENLPQILASLSPFVQNPKEQEKILTIYSGIGRHCPERSLTEALVSIPWVASQDQAQRIMPMIYSELGRRNLAEPELRAALLGIARWCDTKDQRVTLMRELYIHSRDFDGLSLLNDIYDITRQHDLVNQDRLALIETSLIDSVPVQPLRWLIAGYTNSL